MIAWVAVAKNDANDFESHIKTKPTEADFHDISQEHEEDLQLNFEAFDTSPPFSEDVDKDSLKDEQIIDQQTQATTNRTQMVDRSTQTIDQQTQTLDQQVRKNSSSNNIKEAEEAKGNRSQGKRKREVEEETEKAKGVRARGRE